MNISHHPIPPIETAARRCGLKLNPTGREMEAFTCRCWLPDCGDMKQRGHVYMNVQSNTYYCQRCHRGGNSWTLLQQIGTPELRERLKEEARLHQPLRRPIEKADSAIASVDDCSAVYNALLNRLALKPSHRRNLLKRGLPEQEIERGAFRSMPTADSGNGICKLLLKEGYDLNGIPGFFCKDGLWQLRHYPGILIPVRDEYRRIQGFQVRIDDDLVRRGYDKYLWFSSAEKDEGTSSGSPSHIAIPNGYKVRGGRLVNLKHPDRGCKTWLTEGPLKADISALYLGMPVFGVPGVGNHADAIRKASALGVKSTMVAYDADLTRNPQVRQAAKKLILELAQVGITGIPVIWNELSGKGLDDLLTKMELDTLPLPAERLQYSILTNRELEEEIKVELRVTMTFKPQ